MVLGVRPYCENDELGGITSPLCDGALTHSPTHPFNHPLTHSYVKHTYKPDGFEAFKVDSDDATLGVQFNSGIGVSGVLHHAQVVLVHALRYAHALACVVRGGVVGDQTNGMRYNKMQYNDECY